MTETQAASAKARVGSNSYCLSTELQDSYCGENIGFWVHTEFCQSEVIYHLDSELSEWLLKHTSLLIWPKH
jgi:hypothetical protein